MKHFNYKSQIEEGEIIQSWHVSQSVDAFSASANQVPYSISISGSLKVTGSQFIKPSSIPTQTKDFLLSYDTTTGQIFKMSTSSFDDESNFGVYVTGSSNQNIIPSKFGTGSSANINDQLFSTIAGGQCNKISFVLADSICNIFIGAGTRNTASNNNTAIIQGIENQNYGLASTIAGGTRNLTSGGNSFIGGGCNNCINSGISTSIIGGDRNTITGSGNIIGGGQNHLIRGSGSAIISGFSNTNEGTGSFIGTGCHNVIEATKLNSAVIGGKCNLVKHDSAFILGTEITSSVANTTFVNNLHITGSTTNNAVLNLARRSTTPSPLLTGSIWHSGSLGAGCLYFSPNGSDICKIAFA